MERGGEKYFCMNRILVNKNRIFRTGKIFSGPRTPNLFTITNKKIDYFPALFLILCSYSFLNQIGSVKELKQFI
jgi:hypothetical protein